MQADENTQRRGLARVGGSGRRRRRSLIVPLVGSVLVHGLGFWTAAHWTLPRSPSRPNESFAALELIEFEFPADAEFNTASLDASSTEMGLMSMAGASLLEPGFGARAEAEFELRESTRSRDKPTSRPRPRPSSEPVDEPKPEAGELSKSDSLPGPRLEGSGKGEGSGSPGPPGPLITRDKSLLAGLDLDPAGPVPEGPRAPGDPVDRGPRADEGIVELANGSLGYTDPSGDFNAYIRPDGSVRFLDRKSAAVKVCVAFVCFGGGAVRAVERGGKEDRHNMGVDFALVPLGIGGVFGNKLGVERHEMLFLERTYSMRIKMSVRWQRTQINRQLNQLRDQLDEVWDDSRNADDEARRRVLQELWSECDVDGRALPEGTDDLPRELHAARQKAARTARTVIESYYQKRAGRPLW